MEQYLLATSVWATTPTPPSSTTTSMPLVPTISSLRVLSRVCTQNFQVRYSLTGQVLALFHYLYNPWHPLQRKLSAKYSRQEKEFVLVVNTTKKAVSGKSCVRTTVARRIRELVLTELRAQGWSRNGTPLGPKDSKGVGTTADGVRRYPLTGCLAFFPLEESLTVPVAQLRSEVRRGVEVFVELHENARIDALERQLCELQQQQHQGDGFQAGRSPAYGSSHNHNHNPRYLPYQSGGHDLKETPGRPGYDSPRHNYQSGQRGWGRGRGGGRGGRGGGRGGLGSASASVSASAWPGPGPELGPAGHRNQQQPYRGHDCSLPDNRRQLYPTPYHPRPHPHPHPQAATQGQGQGFPGEQKKTTGAGTGGSGGTPPKPGPPPSVGGGGGGFRKRK